MLSTFGYGFMVLDNQAYREQFYRYLRNSKERRKSIYVPVGTEQGICTMRDKYRPLVSFDLTNLR